MTFSRFIYLLRLASRSAWNRRGTLALIMVSVALSTTLLLGIDRLRTDTRRSFMQSVSGTDLIVGARGSGSQLVLYAVFHLGGATANMGWESVQAITGRPEVAWTVPISLGDSHRGYPVVATSADFFTHFRYGRGDTVAFRSGGPFDDVFDIVIGAEAARRLGYEQGGPVTLTHGRGLGARAEHGDKPFRVVGVLAPTGTPVDRSLYISLAGMEAIHLGWQGGAPAPGLTIRPDQVRKFNLQPKSVTALLVGLKSRPQVFAVQRAINTDPGEPLTAVMPGIALDQIWRMLATGERALLAVSALVTLTGVAGLVATILAGLGERRRELAVFRAAGARPLDLLVLLAGEGVAIMVAGVGLGVAATVGLIAALGPVLLDRYGVALSLSGPDGSQGLLVAGILGAGVLASLIPGVRAYRMTLSDGLSVST